MSPLVVAGVDGQDSERFFKLPPVSGSHQLRGELVVVLKQRCRCGPVRVNDLLGPLRASAQLARRRKLFHFGGVCVISWFFSECRALYANANRAFQARAPRAS